MNPKTQEMLDRTLQFGADTIKFAERLPQNSVGWTISRQIVRSATSVGANLQEAQFARSNAEFLSKMCVSLQEASETLYWFRTIEKCGIGDAGSLARLKDEAEQLVSILVAITGTVKRRSRGRV